MEISGNSGECGSAGGTPSVQSRWAQGGGMSPSRPSSAAGPELALLSIDTLFVGSFVPWDRGKAGLLQLRPDRGRTNTLTVSAPPPL